MTEDVRVKWDRRWSDDPAPAGPASFVVSARRFFPPAGRALDVASGPGRHGLWLAALGYETTLVDISTVALRSAGIEARRRGVEVGLVERDLEAEGLPPGRWDVVVIHYFLDREILHAVPASLREGGVVVFCQPTERDLGAEDRIAKRYLLGEDEIDRIAASWGLEILVLEEGRSAGGMVEARVVARRNRPSSAGP